MAAAASTATATAAGVAPAAAHNARGDTSEYAAFRQFKLAWGDGGDAEAAFPGAVLVTRRSEVTVETTHNCLSGVGAPLVVTDALRDWPLHAALKADARAALEWLTNRFGDDTVVVNDRAPARHADAQRGRPQVSVRTTVREYCAHLGGLDASHYPPSAAVPPFYLNGWRAFSDHKELQRDCPMPYFMHDVDLTQLILQNIDAQLFGRTAPSLPTRSESNNGLWYNGMCQALWKLFLGPAGTVTRLHYDAGDAHGWLAQICGAKLFVLFSPDSAGLVPIAGEVETVQSDVDPLACACGSADWPAGVKPHVVVLRPGEAIIIPRGWWHYAVALSTSLTVQCNFYNEKNAAALTATVVKQLKMYKEKSRIVTPPSPTA